MTENPPSPSIEGQAPMVVPLPQPEPGKVQTERQIKPTRPAIVLFRICLALFRVYTIFFILRGLMRVGHAGLNVLTQPITVHLDADVNTHPGLTYLPIDPHADTFCPLGFDCQFNHSLFWSTNNLAIAPVEIKQQLEQIQLGYLDDQLLELAALHHDDIEKATRELADIVTAYEEGHGLNSPADNTTRNERQDIRDAKDHFITALIAFTGTLRYHGPVIQQNLCSLRTTRRALLELIEDSELLTEARGGSWTSYIFADDTRANLLLLHSKVDALLSWTMNEQDIWVKVCDRVHAVLAWQEKGMAGLKKLDKGTKREMKELFDLLEEVQKLVG
ncbi:hypothetical protein NLU13_8867 [Sarocladium strictum]|uniref:Uncharacterized protein n=1 Tax=Sarocladium strictum TaxID=5046 RepID=A0AA39L3E2_SARSR|nr:hypothetical protein NLU13_8867 [Sarocladium strictum]